MPKVTYTGDASQLVKAEQDFQKAQADTEGRFKKIAEASKTADRQTRQFLRAGETAQDRYNKKLAESVQLVKRGAITQADATRVLARHRKKLEEAEAASKGAFGARAIANIGAVATGYLSANAALQAGVTLLREQQRLVEEAAQRSRESRRGLSELAQLAATSAPTQAGREKAFKDFVAESKAFRASGATDSLDQAGRDVFKLTSAELSRADRDFARDVQASGALSNIGDAAKAFAAIKTNLGSAAPKTFRDFLDQAIQASSIAPAQAPEIPLAASNSAGSANALGLGSEFLNAGTAILAKATGTASQGGTQLAAFLKGIEAKGLTADPSLSGLSGVELVREIKRRKLDRAGLADLLGDRQEAISGFRTLPTALPQLEKAVADIKRADRNDLSVKTIGLPNADPNIRAARLRDVSVAGAEVAEINQSSRLQNLFEAALAERRENRAVGDERLFAGFIQDFITSSTVGSDFQRRNVLRLFLDQNEAGQNRLSDELLTDIRDALQDIRQNTASTPTPAPAPIAGRRE